MEISIILLCERVFLKLCEMVKSFKDKSLLIHNKFLIKEIFQE